MADFTLTTGYDTVIGTAANDTVYGSELTLDDGDRLTGGAGFDVLALNGGGTFRVDQLATFTGFESITLNTTFTSDGAALYLGSQSVGVSGYGGNRWEVFLGSGAVTFQGGGDSNIINSTSASNWNAGNYIDGGTIGQINLNSNGYGNAVYDLTTNILSHINYLSGSGTNLVVKVNSAVAGGVAHFYSSSTNAKLVTSDAALDLSHSTMSGFAVASSNAAGTNFTVSDIETAVWVVGGSGTDTLTAQGFVFSADQRNTIFGIASVERIVDASGTYIPPNPKAFRLTTGSDTFTGTAGNDTVSGTEATLNSGDSLIGGAGTDTLALSGTGTFRVDQLATFTGFEIITLNSFAGWGAALYLDNQSIAVTGQGGSSWEVFLGSGVVTFQGGSNWNTVNSTSASNWNGGNSIDGGTFGQINLNSSGYDNAFYDLTTNTLSHINYLFGSGTNLVVKINSTVAGGVVNFYGSGTNARLVTSDAALDLSHSAVIRPRGFPGHIAWYPACLK